MTTVEDIVKYVEERKEIIGFSPIFEIVMVQNNGKEQVYEKDGKIIHSGFPDMGTTSIVGYYYDIDTAICALNENWGDIRATIFDGAFILVKFPGLYDSCGLEQRMWFVWDEEKQGYYQQEEPRIFANLGY